MKRIICFLMILNLVMGFPTALAESDPAGNFDVLQTAGIRPLWGVSGIALLAYFEEAPGEIYVAREITTPVNLDEGNCTSYLSSCIAKVVDPNGNIAAVYDFAHMDSVGKEYHVFNINENIPGIWKIQFMNGRTTDLFSIGFNGTDIWGIRGEKVLGKSTTLPEEKWVYTQDTLDYFYTAVSTDTPIKLYDEENTLVAESEPTTRAYIKQKIYTQDVLPEKAYRIDYGENFYGEIEIDGVPGLICPSKEAAETLKGGWEKTGGVTVQGPIQKRAREEIIRLIETKDLTFTYEKPKNMPASLDNAMAEAQLFGAYGIVGGIDFAVNNQILDITSPYLGITGNKPVTIPELNWQHGYYSEMKACATVVNAMAGVTGLDLELNYLKDNPALIQRAAIGLLAILTQLTEDDSMRVNNLTQRYVVMTAAMFTMDPFVHAYYEIRDELDVQTREILDEGVIAAVDKMGNYVGQGPTNQALFCMSYTIRAYDIFGTERYHDTFKRQIESLINNTDNQHGISDLGYFLESGGCDGSYEYMNKYHYSSIYEFYKNMPGADEKLVSDIKASIEKNLEFESFFWAPQPYESTVVSLNPTSFASRTDSGVGTDNYPGYTMIWDEFPLARRRYEMQSGNKLDAITAVSYPHRINAEGWALKQIKRYWKSYDKEFADGQGLRNWPLSTYYAYNATDWCEPAENLPFEAKDGTIWNKEGFIAFKHKGIYGTVFYGIDDSTGYETGSLMGGGPTFLWGEGTGKTLLSKKHKDYMNGDSSKKYKVETVDDIVSSCVYATDANGNLIMYSGKEGTSRFGGLENISFNWISQGRTFKISGEIPDGNATTEPGKPVMTGKEVSWTYDLNSSGITLTVGLTGMEQNEAYWVNLPIPAPSTDAGISTEYEKGRLKFKNGSGSMTYEWDSSFTSIFADEVTGINRLRIKLPKNGRLSINISSESPEFVISEMGLYEDLQIGDTRLTEKLSPDSDSQYISYRIRNTTKSNKNVKMLIVHYDSKGKQIGVIGEKKFTLPADKTTRIASDALPITGKSGTVRAFVWADDNKLRPVVSKNEWIIG